MTDIVALGAGRMGRGIAQVFAYAGHPVTILDFKDRPAAQSTALLDAARDEIAQNLGFLEELGVIDGGQRATVMARIQFATMADAAATLSKARFIFEGVPEILAAKADALGRVSNLAGTEAIIASTTSTILVDDLAAFVSGPERFLNAHWLNPAYLIPLVEVSPGAETAAAVVDEVMALLKAVGKVPVRCKASPGYIVPRIQSVAMNEAARIVDEGLATAEDVDTAIRTGFGIRYATMGLIEFIDWGGVDILYYASRYLKEALGSDRFSSPELVDRLMADGHLGLSTGKGFYDYSKTDAEAFRREKLATFVALLRHLDLLPTPKGD
jgi:3-hydroxybutyryl-CoA dehydrogenase